MYIHIIYDVYNGFTSGFYLTNKKIYIYLLLIVITFVSISFEPTHWSYIVFFVTSCIFQIRFRYSFYNIFNFCYKYLENIKNV